jgi:cyclic lactone autoinducer peptide
MLNSNQGGENMKKLAKYASKMLPAFVACLTMVLTVSANSSSCFYLHQEDEPKSINRFKKFK